MTTQAQERVTLHCPFCGSDNVSDGEILSGDVGKSYAQSECQTCGAVGPRAALRAGEVDYGSAKAIAAWNRRATQEVAPAQVVIAALELAMRMCDHMPTRVHQVEGAESWARELGLMVNSQPDGSHGYRLIAVALEAARAALRTAAPQAPVAPARQAEAPRTLDHAWAVAILSAAAKSGDPGAIALAAQLAGAAPCPKCDFVNFACRCVTAPAGQVVEALDTWRLDFIEREWFYRDIDGDLAFRFNECWTAGNYATLREAIDAAVCATRTQAESP